MHKLILDNLLLINHSNMLLLRVRNNHLNTPNVTVK